MSALHPRLVPLWEHGERYTLDEEWACEGFTIPKGFCTDGASIPQFFWSWIGSPFLPSVIEAAIVHDYLYKHHETTRKEAAAIFREMLLERGVPRWKAHRMWLAVRIFGGFYY